MANITLSGSLTTSGSLKMLSYLLIGNLYPTVDLSVPSNTRQIWLPRPIDFAAEVLSYRADSQSYSTLKLSNLIKFSPVTIQTSSSLRLTRNNIELIGHLRTSSTLRLGQTLSFSNSYINQTSSTLILTYGQTKEKDASVVYLEQLFLTNSPADFEGNEIFFSYVYPEFYTGLIEGSAVITQEFNYADLYVKLFSDNRLVADNIAVAVGGEWEVLLQIPGHKRAELWSRNGNTIINETYGFISELPGGLPRTAETTVSSFIQKKQESNTFYSANIALAFIKLDKYLKEAPLYVDKYSDYAGLILSRLYYLQDKDYTSATFGGIKDSYGIFELYDYVEQPKGGKQGVSALATAVTAYVALVFRETRLDNQFDDLIENCIKFLENYAASGYLDVQDSTNEINTFTLVYCIFALAKVPDPTANQLKVLKQLLNTFNKNHYLPYQQKFTISNTNREYNALSNLMGTIASGLLGDTEKIINLDNYLQTLIVGSGDEIAPDKATNAIKFVALYEIKQQPLLDNVYIGDEQGQLVPTLFPTYEKRKYIVTKKLTVTFLNNMTTDTTENITVVIYKNNIDIQLLNVPTTFEITESIPAGGYYRFSVDVTGRTPTDPTRSIAVSNSLGLATTVDYTYEGRYEERTVTVLNLSKNPVKGPLYLYNKEATPSSTEIKFPPKISITSTDKLRYLFLEADKYITSNHFFVSPNEPTYSYKSGALEQPPYDLFLTNLLYELGNILTDQKGVVCLPVSQLSMIGTMRANILDISGGLSRTSSANTPDALVTALYAIQSRGERIFDLDLKRIYKEISETKFIENSIFQRALNFIPDKYTFITDLSQAKNLKNYLKALVSPIADYAVRVKSIRQNATILQANREGLKYKASLFVEDPSPFWSFEKLKEETLYAVDGTDKDIVSFIQRRYGILILITEPWKEILVLGNKSNLNRKRLAGRREYHTNLTIVNIPSSEYNNQIIAAYEARKEAGIETSYIIETSSYTPTTSKVVSFEITQK